MRTEEEIIYSIIETVKKGEVNQDNKLNERLLRTFLHKYRARLLSDLPEMISGENFQYVGQTFFYFVRGQIYEATNIPKLIKLPNSFGVMLELNGENIPLLEREDFNLGIKNPINGFLPKATLMNDRMKLFIGKKQDTSCGFKPKDNYLINDFLAQLNSNLTSSKIRVYADLYAVLMNPDDASDYDWTRDPFPLDAELIEQMTNSILQYEFNIILQTQTDKVTDGNNKPEI